MLKEFIPIKSSLEILNQSQPPEKQADNNSQPTLPFPPAKDWRNDDPYGIGPTEPHKPFDDEDYNKDKGGNDPYTRKNNN